MMRRTYWRRADGSFFAKDVAVGVTFHLIQDCDPITKDEFDAGVLERFQSMSGDRRVVVTGGRDYSDREVIYDALDSFRDDLGVAVLIHGAASGADTRARFWAKERGVPDLPFPAAWEDLSHPEAIMVRSGRSSKPYNPLAGFIRNQQMVDEGKPDCCMAFKGGSGTADMKDRCVVAGIPVFDMGGDAA